jgi:hypothetical protein
VTGSKDVRAVNEILMLYAILEKRPQASLMTLLDLLAEVSDDEVPLVAMGPLADWIFVNGRAERKLVVGLANVNARFAQGLSHVSRGRYPRRLLRQLEASGVLSPE